MPWTFAHPAAVLPLRSFCPRWLSFPGLVIGSITPDLSYYFGQLGWASFAHTPLGLLAFCLPSGLLLITLLVWFAEPATVLLPSPHRQIVRSSLQRPNGTTLPLTAVAAVSVLIGAASHIAWDSFTHVGRSGAALIPILNMHIFSAADRDIRVLNILQHLSTVLGLLAMAVVYRRVIRLHAERFEQAAITREASRKRWLIVCIVLGVLLGTVFAMAATSLSETAHLSRMVVRTVVWSTTSFALVYIAASLYWWRQRGDT